MASRAGFLGDYPEFNGATSTLVDTKLAEAMAFTSTTIYPTSAQYDAAVYARTASLLLICPFGMEMRQNDPDRVLAVEWRLRGMQRTATQGMRVFLLLLGCGEALQNLWSTFS